MSKSIGCLLAIGAVVLLAVLYGVGVYNGLVGAEQAVEAQWAQVEAAYQRRADLIPNLVATVRGSAAFERETLEAVVQARSRVGQISAQVGSEILNDPQRFEQFQQAQEGLNSALGRLIAVAESYPQLQSTTAFRDLMVQLEGTENRITVERNRFNEVAQGYNTRVRRFPAALFAGMFGFEPKPYFRSQPGAETAPRVDFGTAPR
ncbi:MAG TPA: LemA family protein [Thermoanaerobaculia bacterium]|nr:LemA family protein [Thermoanaerobaculia bacterium]